MRKLSFCVGAVAIALLLALAYSNTFQSPPTLDDYHSFLQEEKVHLKDISPHSLLSLSDTVFGWYRWIPMVTFGLDYWMGKGSIVYFHVTNLLIHMGCMVAVFFLSFQLLSMEEEKRGKLPSMIPASSLALAIAGLWALNPVQTNAVTYMVQRMASIQAFFFIGSIAFYILARKTSIKNSRALGYYGLCSLFALGAFLSKENSAMLPPMLLVTEVWFFRPDLPRSFWRALRQSGRLSKGLALFFLLVIAVLTVKTLQAMQAGYQIRHFTMGERLLTEARIVLWYITLLIWPAPSRLSLEHDIEVSTSLFNPPTTAFSLLALILLLLLTVRYRRRYPLLSYGSMWFFINLAIESTVVPLELVFEHRLYLPSVGFFLVVGAGAAGLWERAARLGPRAKAVFALCIFSLLLIGSGALTYERNKAWENAVTLQEDTVAKAPKNPRARANLAVAYGRSGQYAKALKEAETAIALGRDNYESYDAAANAVVGSLRGLGRNREAVRRGEELLANSPDSRKKRGLMVLCLNIAAVYKSTGQIDKAYSVLSKGAAFECGRVDMCFEKSQVLKELESVVVLAGKNGVDLNGDSSPDPGVTSPKLWLARELLRTERPREARWLLSQAAAESPGDRETSALLEVIERGEKDTTK